MNIPLKWIKGFSLSTKSDYYYPINWHNNIFSSNGLASGNTIEEAILQAICELIERENVYRLFVLKMPGKYVDPGSINHPLIKKTFAESASQGIDFLIKDISSELAVPTFVVRGTKENDRGKLTYQGCGQGASPAPIKALIRSIAEYFEGFLIMASSQDRMKFEAGAYIGSMPKKHLGFITLLNPEILEESRGRESFSDIPDMSMNDIKDEIEWIIDLLHKLGHEVVVINKTLPQLRIPVVRVFIPMMRSCINTEILRPESLVAQAYFEAGDTVSANKYIRESISKDPVLRNLSPFLSNVPAELFFKKDYIESMLAFNAFKKNGIDFLNKFSGSIPGILQGKKLS
jgi:ribosomal protein S12 methylthiotransferase accessory factor